MMCWLPRWAGPRVIAALGVALAVVVHFGVAYADGGEAGLVIQHGDGSVDTYCVGFQGDSISGADLLAKAGIPVVQFNGAVCAIGTQEGCFQPSSYDTCYCMSFPPTSTYWGFFREPYGKQWQYSAVGYQDPRSALRDGEMEAWRWGKGGPNNAPSPAAMTFEQVCGHSPRGGAVSSSVTLAATVAAPTSAGGTTAAATASGATALPVTVLAPSVSSEERSPSPGAQEGPVVRAHGTATAVPQAPATGPTDGGGSDLTSLIAFGVVVAVLFGAIGASIAWRRHRGA